MRPDHNTACRKRQDEKKAKQTQLHDKVSGIQRPVAKLNVPANVAKSVEKAKAKDVRRFVCYFYFYLT
jgi:hypothetical protein